MNVPPPPRMPVANEGLVWNPLHAQHVRILVVTGILGGGPQWSYSVFLQFFTYTLNQKSPILDDIGFMTWCWFQRVCKEFLPPWHHECCVAGGNSQPQNYGTLTSTKTFQTQRKTKSLSALDAFVSNICQNTCKYYYQSEIHACHCMSMGCWMAFSLTQFQRAPPSTRPDLTCSKAGGCVFLRARHRPGAGRAWMWLLLNEKDGLWRGVFLQKPSEIGKGRLRHATFQYLPWL